MELTTGFLDQKKTFWVPKWVKHFNVYVFISLDFNTPSIYGDQHKFFTDNLIVLAAAMKYKFQLTKWLSTGTDLNYSIINYNMAEKVAFYPILYGETGFF